MKSIKKKIFAQFIETLIPGTSVRNLTEFLKNLNEFCYFQVDVKPLKPCSVESMMTLDVTPVDLVLDGTHIGRGDMWVETTDGNNIMLCLLVWLSGKI